MKRTSFLILILFSLLISAQWLHSSEIVRAEGRFDEGAQLGSAYREISQKEFSVVIPEDIDKLYEVAIERGERPSCEGRLFLKFRSGGFRQYVTLTLGQGLFGGFAAIERIDFVQEQWQVNVLGQDEIDQWVVVTNGKGTALHVWHKCLREDKGTVLKEQFLPADEQGAKAIVEKIVAHFLLPMA
jgi:hypothetical protein